MTQFSFLLAALLCLIAACHAQNTLPSPWTRVLEVADPVMEGSDVVVAQNLLKRDASVSQLEINGEYDATTASAVSAFQKAHSLAVDGTMGAKTAQELLDCCSADGVTDDGFTAASRGYVKYVGVMFYLEGYKPYTVVALLLSALGSPSLSLLSSYSIITITISY